MLRKSFSKIFEKLNFFFFFVISVNIQKKCEYYFLALSRNENLEISRRNGKP